jgi:hypothetical protein
MPTVNASASTAMSLSHDLAQKAVQAAIAAIDIYNKPDFHFREEAFSLLMTNSWELLLKGKWLADHAEDVTSLYEYDHSRTDPTKRKLRVNRCGGGSLNRVSRCC